MQWGTNEGWLNLLAFLLTFLLSVAVSGISSLYIVPDSPEALVRSASYWGQPLKGVGGYDADGVNGNDHLRELSDGTRKSQPNDTLITLERSICYGPCPSYKVTITAAGNVTFEGRQNVNVKDVVKGHISREEFRSLIAAFEGASYFTLNDSYQTQKDGCPEVWTDNPWATTSI